jgi:hypothetical protein
MLEDTLVDACRCRSLPILKPPPLLSFIAQGTDSDMSTPCNSGMRFKSGRCIPDKMVPEVRALQRFQELQLTKKEGQAKKNTVHVKPLFHASPLRNGPAGQNKDTSTAMEMDSAGNPVLYTAKELKEQEAKSNNHDDDHHGNHHGNTQTTAVAPLSSITDFEREFRQLSFTTFVQEEETLMTPPHHLGKCSCSDQWLCGDSLVYWGCFLGCIGVVFWVVLGLFSALFSAFLLLRPGPYERHKTTKEEQCPRRMAEEERGQHGPETAAAHEGLFHSSSYTSVAATSVATGVPTVSLLQTENSRESNRGNNNDDDDDDDDDHDYDRYPFHPDGSHRFMQQAQQEVEQALNIHYDLGTRQDNHHDEHYLSFVETATMM